MSFARVALCALLAAASHEGAHAGGAKPRTAEDEIREADLAMGRAVAAGDVEAFKRFIAPDGAFFGGAMSVGPDAVAAAWAVLLDPEGRATLRWVPTTIEVARSGELGFSRGDYERRVRGDDGAWSLWRGHYVTIWRRGRGGAWQAVVDIGTPGTLAAENVEPVR